MAKLERRGPDGTWLCVRCESYFPEPGFVRRGDKPHSYCRHCSRAAVRASYRKDIHRNREEKRKGAARYAAQRTPAQKAERAVYLRSYYEGKEKGRQSIRRDRRYGMPDGSYDAMFERQNGVCAACGLPERIKRPDGTVAALTVDHCHDTGAVRGLLCRTCNAALGQAKDDPALLRRLADYVERTTR